MAISSSLYSSISGLSTMGEAMSVLGDNVANLNTLAFKSSRSTFQDVLAQSVSTAAGTAQIGRGVTLSTVEGLFAQGSFESSTNATDMAIGGQGFFILRAPGTSEASLYSRDGEFSFDQNGNLVNPSGDYVQGWSIDQTTGDREGTIGDINLGKSTPPVATSSIDLIYNLDASQPEETTEVPLYDAWDGRNAAQASPTSPIDASNYAYTTSTKVYDSKGASHDITTYFATTDQPNVWQYLVTCDPSEDKRNLSPTQQTVYAPDTTYNYENDKGAGALLYGTIQFSTSGDIDQISAYNVPPDGEVDPAQTTNREYLSPSQSYYTFDTNFTGNVDPTDTTHYGNQPIALNFGATYSGLPTLQKQVLVSDGGALDNSATGTYATKETLWGSVYDTNGNQVANGDTMIFSGFDHDGNQASLVYNIDSTNKVSDLLDQLGTTFGCTASIDADGRLVLTDNTGGESGLAITKFATISTTGATPFGGATSVTNGFVTTTSPFEDVSGNAIKDPTTALTSVYDTSGNQLANGDTFTFSGTAVDGTDVTTAGNNTFTVGTTGTTIQDLLNYVSDLYTDGNVDGNASGVTATLGADGTINIIDNTGGGNLQVGITNTAASGADFSGASAPAAYTESEINVTTSKQQILSTLRGLTTNSGQPPAITADTLWSSVYNEAGQQVPDGETLSFTGYKGDGTAISSTTAGNSYTISSTDTVQSLLDFLSNLYDADASIDQDGRLVLTDRVSNSSTYTSQLAINSITDGGGGGSPIDIFGDSQPFATIPGDTGSGDGSQEGGTVSATFAKQALSSTQYSSPSTTIFQDQDGYASGFLQSVSVDTNGIITGHYSNGQVLKKAQVALATFNSVSGLTKDGGNMFSETSESGAPITGAANTNGLGSIAPNSLEQSNVDLGNEFVNLITVERGYQANAKIITTTGDMLNDLINIIR